MRMEHSDWKYVTVGRLRALLADLPDHVLIGPNAVMNLALVDAAGDYAGYVDLAQAGELVPAYMPSA